MFSIGRNQGGPLRAACLLMIGVALAAFAAPGGARGDDPKPPLKDETKLHELLQARLEAARQTYKVRVSQYQSGTAGFEVVEAAGRRLFTAEMDLLDKKEDRVSACEKNVERCTVVKELAEARFKVGVGGEADLADAEYDRLDAAILLEREKAK